MAQQELSPKAKGAIAALNALSLTELATVLEIASAKLATKIRDAVPNSTPEKRAEASAQLVEGVKAALAHGVEQATAVPTISIGQMKKELRAAGCLYDNADIWRKLKAQKVPAIPDRVIREAYETGGRVFLRCSSISKKADALREANHSVVFWGDARQEHYRASVSEPEWAVLPSHIDRSTLGLPKSKVVTSKMPAPTPEDWFSVIAYARLDGGQQPKGCEGLHAFTTETGTVVGSLGDSISVYRDAFYDHRGGSNIGAARFGPPRN